MDRILPKGRSISVSAETAEKGKLLRAVNSVAEILLTADAEGFDDSLRKAMSLVAGCLDIDRIYIWKNSVYNGQLQYVQQFEWLSDLEPQGKLVSHKEGFVYEDSIPEWEEKFLRGECVNGPLSSLSAAEKTRLGPYGIKSILVVPVHLQNQLWGFVSFDDCHQERMFREDEISILRSANLMLASALDRHETAAKIREADEHTKLMLDAMPLCCSLWDRELNIINCNEAVVQLFRLADKQEYINGFYDLSPQYQPDGQLSIEKARGKVDLAFREGKTVFEWMHQMLNGEPLPAEVTLVRVRRGEEFIVVGYARDLREHKKMMRAIEYKDTLLHTVNEMAAILLSSKVAEFESDLVCCLGMIAKAVDADRMYICKNFEKDGWLYGSILYEWSEGVEPQIDALQNVFYSENAPDWEERLSSGQCINALVKDMSPVEQAKLSPQGILSILVIPVFLHGRFWGFVGFDDCHRERLFSETEKSIMHSSSFLIASALLRNEMTHDIHNAIEQAQAASKAKSTFLACMSHEIRTPMNVIAGMTELILREDIPPAIYEHVLSVKQASANMLSLISDVLDFSKIEAGSLELVSTEYFLTSLINNVLIIIRMKISEKRILFTANIDSNIPNRLIGDETRVRQILLNVMDNAAKYTTEGFISLNISGEVSGDTVILTAKVSDSGIGIKEEHIDTLFDDFTRFDHGKNKSVQGTGLGLAITKNLCQAMDGDISVASVYGQGSTFTITIPQKIKSPQEKFATVSAPETKTVLLYETRGMYADSIIRSLNDLQVRCDLVQKQKDFYQALKRQRYPFVFVASGLSAEALRIAEELGQHTTMVLLMEFGESPAIYNARAIAMPVHAASIANILDDIEDNVSFKGAGQENVRFIAPRAKILVVDDLNTNLKVAQGLMLPYQMQVDICTSGAQAVEYVQQKHYDIIFMDHMMPEMDGIETTGLIRALEGGSGYFKKVPIIALTANAGSEVKQMFLQNGLNDFLAKPIDVSKLHGLLDKWVPEEKKEKYTKKRLFICSPAKSYPLEMHIEGVNVQDGIAMAGGKADSYLKMLAMFQVDGLDRIAKIHDCVEKNNFELYTIHVHALKSAAASIGAQEVSDLFESLEAAGKKGDAKFIRENTDHILGKLMALLKKIQVVLAKKQDGAVRETDPELLREELVKLREALQNKDAGEIDDIMSILETIKLEQEDIAVFKEITRNILLVNYAEAAFLVDQLLKEPKG